MDVALRAGLSAAPKPHLRRVSAIRLQSLTQGGRGGQFASRPVVDKTPERLALIAVTTRPDEAVPFCPVSYQVPNESREARIAQQAGRCAASRGGLTAASGDVCSNGPEAGQAFVALIVEPVARRDGEDHQGGYASTGEAHTVLEQ